MQPVDPTQTIALIQNITHQAINPLNGVIGTLDNLIDGTIKGDRRDQRIKSARAQLEYTVSLIRNLAYFAQYGTSSIVEPKFKITKICVIPQLLIEAAQFFQEQAAHNEIRFEVKDRSNQTSVHGDPELMRQIFMNIFDNYTKYGDSNSTVEIKHWIQKRTNHLIIEFSGRGTPFSNEEDIFALGVRGKQAEEKTSAGSGLGLHICRLIIERLFKGTISASYVNAKRLACFEVRIPNAFITESQNG
ncbi:sensor histidine kinase [Paludibacterium purpuratum]|uniref:Histidine kinase/DNA gyrase B/HSP90-like ATPase n=1 Tax=Paludibacterium purpuratum TaxID=1144873 RepID=A0A4R7BDD1_9NEIS|nr:HAMP domain-containing sensor histidine kinase [Paludibacterium purpuratum]TDR82998.1 histidine kinase/DNA gyrase B/HSP90-like ATPase [Paludibacterium purpuratum]